MAGCCRAGCHMLVVMYDPALQLALGRACWYWQRDRLLLNGAGLNDTAQASPLLLANFLSFWASQIAFEKKKLIKKSSSQCRKSDLDRKITNIEQSGYRHESKSGTTSKPMFFATQPQKFAQRTTRFSLRVVRLATRPTQKPAGRLKPLVCGRERGQA